MRTQPESHPTVRQTPLKVTLRQRDEQCPARSPAFAGRVEGGPLRLGLEARERAGPTSAESGAAYWMGHLFVDADGVPTLVEVKRATDTRIRREVVGQMLDYAANGARYWPGALLQRSFE